MNAVVEKPWTRVIQKVEPHFNEIAEKTGNLVTFKREAMFALQAVNASEYLQECNPDSVFNALVNVASVGLTLSPAEKLAYLVPRKGVCCLDISYRGLVKIATDSGGVAAVSAEIVRENDDFEWFDKFTKPRHRFDPFAPTADRGDVRGVYCIAILSSGIVQVEALSMQEIKKIRDKSKAESGPWFDWPEEMMKKTVVRRASKLWPHSERMQTAVSILDQHQGLDLDDREPAQPAVEQPRAVVPATSGGTPHAGDQESPPPAAAPAEEKPKASPRQMTGGQIRIIRAKMKQRALSDTDFTAKWGKALGDEQTTSFLFSDYDAIIDWIASANTMEG